MSICYGDVQPCPCPLCFEARMRGLRPYQRDTVKFVMATPRRVSPYTVGMSKSWGTIVKEHGDGKTKR